MAGRWHIGRGFDCVCKSVPLSNLLGSCFAYSGCPRVFTVSLKSAGAKYVVNVLAVPSGKQCPVSLSINLLTVPSGSVACPLYSSNVIPQNVNPDLISFRSAAPSCHLSYASFTLV
ncbi:uncharacterized protein TNCT_490821 [Trichonephila clavata]|uniref:Uncharacterized protein n=1 Tax=Trichonephila clavata TaxID=2740835 RepID=A0A8X6GIP6_TRICU|nr:uncharacterized protein TNCT_490821 [Trichonephila clavata]